MPVVDRPDIEAGANEAAVGRLKVILPVSVPAPPVWLMEKVAELAVLNVIVPWLSPMTESSNVRAACVELVRVYEYVPELLVTPLPPINR